ncbi:hypothetical protein MKW94_006320 [Papaver nudicaule]|uniref:Uncharacterized protein n=1 Tax=Papaver nudicaule TaxID=74823 RepID=A0AA41S165_PAPNU|nr:hypothetical protein [Papaver nudicaule]
MDSLQSNDTGVPPRRSPRIAAHRRNDTGVPPRRSPRIVAHLQELEKEKEKERRNQLRRDEYKAKQEAMTEHEKQAQAEKHRITYHNRKMKIAAATQQLPTIRAHDHEASTSRSFRA